MNSTRRLLAPQRVFAALGVGLVFILACGLPLRYAYAARRQAQLQLAHALLLDKPDAPGVIAAAFLPYPIFAVTILLIGRQTLKLKHRYEELQRELRLT